MDGLKLRKNFPEIADAIVSEAEKAYEGLLILPGTMGKRFFVGSPVKWNENPVGNKEYVYSLNRMGHLKTMAEAYAITGESRFRDKVLSELRRWTDTILPPSLDDIDAFSECSPWRALEVGSRGYSSWPAIIDSIPESREILKDSAAVHMRIILTVSPKLWPKANHNHYLIENLGLLSLSSLFPELDIDGEYRSHAERELDRCLAAQVTEEGAQIEGCPSYHNACLSLFALRSYITGENIPVVLSRMFEHSVHATMNTGGNFPIGDSHCGDKETVMLPAVSLYLATGDRKYIETALHFEGRDMLMKEIAASVHMFRDYDRLKADIDATISSDHSIKLPTAAFQRSIGESFIRTGWNRNDISVAMIARSPIQNNHAHIDPCSFIMTASGKPLILDPGIYTYREGSDRYRYKSTRYHSTVSINGKDAWQYISSWKYGPQKRSCITRTEKRDGLIIAEMVSECYGNALIKRTMALLDEGMLIILDSISGTAIGDTAEISFNVSSKNTAAEGRTIYTEDEGANIMIQTAIGEVIREDGFYSPVLDIEQKTTMVRNRIVSDGRSMVIPTVLIPFRSGSVPRKAVIVSEEDRSEIRTENSALIYEKGEIGYIC